MQKEMGKQKVLIITTISGFLQQFELNDVRILQALGYEVHYASNFETSVYGIDNEQLQKLGIVIHPISIQKSPCAVGKNLKALRELCRIIREERILAIHCHNPLGGVVGRLAAFLGGKKRPYVLYTAHGFHFYKGAPFVNWMLFFPAEYLLARLTDCLITVNEEDYQRVCAMPLKKGGRAERIPSVGIAEEKFSDRAELRMGIREKHGIPEDCFYILTAGELNRNKNQQVLLHTVALLGQEKIHLGICGEGSCREGLKVLAEELGITEKVSFLGYRNDLWELLAAADAFAFPSIREGFAIAPLEALAAGLPLITSERRDSREYIRDEENGFLCRKNIPQEYVRAIRILIKQPELRKKMSENGREAAKKYALPKTECIMKKIYSSIAREHPVRSPQQNTENQAEWAAGKEGK